MSKLGNVYELDFNTRQMMVDKYKKIVAEEALNKNE